VWGIYVAKVAADGADNFVSSVAQDIVERWTGTIRTNAIETLEACLFLTQSSCKAPDQLESELKTKIINLSQVSSKRWPEEVFQSMAATILVLPAHSINFLHYRHSPLD
jgi:hypothetical protein